MAIVVKILKVRPVVGSLYVIVTLQVVPETLPRMAIFVHES